MPIYDYDGAARNEIGKVYDYDGAARNEIGKVYDWDGLVRSEIYTAGLGLADIDFTVSTVNGNATEVSDSLLKIVSSVQSGLPHIYADMDVTSYNKLSFDLAHYTHYAYVAAGLYKSASFNTGTKPDVGYYVKNTGDESTISHPKQTHTYDISDLTGVYRFVLFVSKTSTKDAWVELTDLLIE